MAVSLQLVYHVGSLLVRLWGDNEKNTLSGICVILATNWIIC